VSKLERLLKLLAVLLDTAMPLSAENLRRRIGGYPEVDATFRRTFERDKDDLRSMGVAIRVASVPGTEPPLDGYIVDQDVYAGQDPGLEPDELAALHLAAALVRVDELGDDAFWKLGGSGDANPTGEPTSLGAVAPSDDAGLMHTAIAERRVATFRYRDTDRELEPARISFTRGQWYVSGHDRVRGAERVFRIDRIEGTVRLGQSNAFERRPARGPEVTRTWELGDEEPIAATVRIDAEVALWARVHLRPDEIEPQADGSVLVNMSVRNTDAFRDWVLSFLDNAEVISPESFRTVITDWLQSVREGVEA
jgi:proteasome accessory factor B